MTPGACLNLNAGFVWSFSCDERKPQEFPLPIPSVILGTDTCRTRDNRGRRLHTPVRQSTLSPSSTPPHRPSQS